ncbi:MAG: hydrolase [Chloroflexi bacterium]|nr:MAG: hydrolase [Chloroflexota bacterium]
MEAWVCRTCGVQQAPTAAPPAACAICQDERQYVPPQGQRWATLAELGAEGRHIEVRDLEPGLTGIGGDPPIGIGQRALLVQTPAGNFLWDCLGFIDEKGVAAVKERGGLHGIAFSHPHFYGVCVEWSQAFGGAPIYIPRADGEWVMRPDPAVTYWEGTLAPLPGLTLVQSGGHFEGSAVLHWAGGANGQGALLTGDTITVVADRRFVSFMRSYPNEIPLSPADVQRIASSVRPYQFDRIYGGWWDRVVESDGQGAIERSADRYVRWVEGRREAG